MCNQLVGSEANTNMWLVFEVRAVLWSTMTLTCEVWLCSWLVLKVIVLTLFFFVRVSLSYERLSNVPSVILCYQPGMRVRIHFPHPSVPCYTMRDIN